MKRFELSRPSFQSAAQTLTTLALAATMGLTACGPKNYGHDSGALNIGLGSTLDLSSYKSFAQSPDSQSTKDAAESLAKAAELMAVNGKIVSAHEVARFAMKLDAENKRARLWVAITAPAMEFKGFYARITPFVKEQLPQDYAKFVNKVNAFKYAPENKAVAGFMTEGPQDIHNERELQDLIARVTLRFDELRKTFKDLNGEDLKITYAANADTSCSMGQKIGNDLYSFEPCKNIEYKDYDINGADFMAMQQYVGGMQTMLTLYNAYSLSGLAKNHSRIERMSGEKALKTLFANPDFGVLRSDARLGVLPEIGKDLIMSVRTAMEMREEACVGDSPESEVSIGFAFAKSFCGNEEDSLTKILSIAETVLNSSRTIVPVEQNDRIKMVEVQTTKLFKEPIQNMRTLLPISFDACGNVSGLGDNTLGGILPNADLGWMLAASNDSCK